MRSMISTTRQLQDALAITGAAGTAGPCGATSDAPDADLRTSRTSSVSAGASPKLGGNTEQPSKRGPQ